MTLFKECCFCVPLRVGCFILAYILAVIKAIIFVLVCKNFVTILSMANEYPWLNDDSNFLFMRVMNIVYVIINISEVTLAIILLVGLHKNIRKLMRTYIIGASVVNAIFLVILLFIFVRNVSYYTLMEWLITSTEFVITVTCIYCILVVRSYYMKTGKFTPQPGPALA